MALKPQTEEHLARAERNRAVAQVFFDPQQNPALQPPPLEWAAVAAFYAAVHYVHVLLWERWGLRPMDHPTRRGYVGRTQPLKTVLGAYDILADLAWQARYARTFRSPPAEVRQAVDGALESIRRVVYQDLGISTS
jgi:hypothetical protein